jgi:hypothetical protein
MSNATVTKIAAGDILKSTWGYEQTNVEFFMVLKRTPKMATVVQVRSDLREKPGEFMVYTATPAMPLTPYGKAFARKVQTYDGSEFLERTSYAALYPWNGEPVNGSSYA